MRVTVMAAALGLAAIGFCVAESPAGADDKQPAGQPAGGQQKVSDQDLQKALEIGAKAKQHVEKAFHHCYEQVKAGKTDHAEVMHLLADTSAVYGATGTVTGRRSEVAGVMNAACAEVCDRCAAACEKFGSEPVMKECAELCRQHAKSCRELAQKFGHTGAPGAKGGK